MELQCCLYVFESMAACHYWTWGQVTWVQIILTGSSECIGWYILLCYMAMVLIHNFTMYDIYLSTD